MSGRLLCYLFTIHFSLPALSRAVYEVAHILGAKRPTAPPLGELLSECEAEGVRYDICNMPKVTHDTPSVSPFGLPAFNS